MPKTTGRDEAQSPPDPRQGAAPPKARSRTGRGQAEPVEQAGTPGRHGSLPQDEPPAYDDIARRAYELYQERGGGDGREVDDWLRAEAELRGGRGRRDDET